MVPYAGLKPTTYRLLINKYSKRMWVRIPVWTKISKVPKITNFSYFVKEEGT